MKLLSGCSPKIFMILHQFNYLIETPGKQQRIVLYLFDGWREMTYSLSWLLHVNKAIQAARCYFVYWESGKQSITFHCCGKYNPKLFTTEKQK